MKKTLSLFAAALMCIATWAQTSIQVDVHNIVELQERFNVGFVVEGEHSPSDFQWEAGDDFTVVWGPQKGSSTSIQIMNGKTTKTAQTTFTYILQAKKTGTFTLPAATAKIKGKQIQSKAVQIQVVNSAAASGSGAQASSSQPSQRQSQQASRGESDIFMRLSLSRNSVVVGEPVTATLKIYQRANLAGFEDARFPSFKGFWSQEVDTPQNIEFQREQVDGVMYNSAILRQWVLIPQKSGAQTIEAAEIVCLVNVQRPRTSGSPFDDFFGTGYVTTRQRVATQPRTIQVSALPGGAPASFSGGVGQFKMSARVSKDSLKTHDAASLIVTVSGKGNIALVEAPKIAFPPDFEVYDIKTSVNTDKSGTSGSKTFEYPFIPRSHGDFVIDPVKFSYYDVGARKYETVSSAPLPISVARSGSASTGSVQDSGTTLVVDRKGVRNLGEDIRFIRTKTSLKAGTSFIVHSALWWIVIAVLLLAGLGFWLGFRKIAARRADVVGSRNRKATRQALKRLAQAREFLQKNLYTAFYEELHRSLLGFVSDKLAMDMAEQTKENISASLVQGGVKESLAGEFVDLLSACEEARYSPDAGHDAMNAHYEKAVELITAIDSSMKKIPSHGGPGAAFLALLLILAPLSMQAAQSYPDSLWNSGVQAYSAGDYATALQDWEGVLDTGLGSKDLYYNLGNAYFKSGEVASAILWYERALRLDPSDSDVRYNLDYARALTQDRIEEVPEIFFKQWGRAICYLLPSNTWAVFSLVFLAFTVALGLLFLLGRTSGRRRLGFFVGIVCLLLSLLSWNFANWQRKDAQRQDMAIVMRPVTSVKSSPSAEGAKDLFILHEGTRVRILDNVGDFSNIELADGRQGWIQVKDIEVI